MNNSKRKIKWFNYLAYGGADLYGGGAFFIVTTFSMYYLVNVIGMHPVLAGLIPAIGKIWDAISDPLMGYIADRTPENRFGKRKVWFLVSIIPIALTFALIWYPSHAETQAGKFIFYTAAYIFFFTVATVSYIPYAALSAEMTHDTKERNLLNSTRIFFSFIATLLGGVIAQPIISSFNGSKEGYFVMGIIFALIFAIPWIFLYFGTWEIKDDKKEVKKDVNFMKNFFSLFKNKSCRWHIAMYIGSFGTLDIFMSWILFYLVDYLGREKYFVVAQGSLLIMMIVMIPFYNKIANKKGHAASYKIGLSIFVLGMILMAFQTPTTPVAFLIVNVVILGSGISAGCLIPHQLLPFVTDVDKLISGEDRAGTYSAAMTLSRKLFLGLIIMTSLGALLSGIGYRNPVPSVLTQNQYNEAYELSKTQSKDKLDNFISSYELMDDGNYHLKYYPHINAKEIVSSKIKDFSVKDPNKLTEQEYKTALSKLNSSDFIEVEYIFALEQQYDKVNNTYVFNNKNLSTLDKEYLYDLKVFLDDIDYKYTGIGEVRKPMQKQSTLNLLKIFFIILPLTLSILGVLSAFRFPLNPKNHKIILDEVERLENGGKKEDASELVRKTCKEVSGIDYDDIRKNS